MENLKEKIEELEKIRKYLESNPEDIEIIKLYYQILESNSLFKDYLNSDIPSYNTFDFISLKSLSYRGSYISWFASLNTGYDPVYKNSALQRNTLFLIDRILSKYEK